MKRASRTASVAIALLSVALQAKAHLAPPRVRADRTIVVTLGERTTLLYAVRLSPTELARLRAKGDLDRDGQLSHDEAERVIAELGDALSSSLGFASGRSRVGALHPIREAQLLAREADGLEGATTDVDPFRAVGGRLAWTFALPLARDDDRLHVEDASDFLPFDHTDVLVKETPARPLVGLGDDPSRLERRTQLGWIDAAQGAHHAFDVAFRAPPKRRDVLFVSLAAIAVAAVALLLLRRRSAT